MTSQEIIQSMPHDAHPMGVLVSAMSALSIFHPDANPALRGQDIYKSKQVRDKQIVRILGKAPTIAAAAYLRMAGRPPVLPSGNLSYAENFLYMLDSMGNTSYKPNPRLARVLDILFILHAEHEMNCSTAAARHLASSGVDVYTAVAGAVGALYGPLHGGANEAVLKMLAEIGSVENIPEFIEGVKNRKRKMSGFGHRVYKNYDPRAKVIKKLADEVFSIVGRDPLIEHNDYHHHQMFHRCHNLLSTAVVTMSLYPTVSISSAPFVVVSFPPPSTPTPALLQIISSHSSPHSSP
ncbi:hypothetical protein DY000_02061725 [Brassica cretica]|uniref:Citrate synthase n=1 Tax=Brassica cretica TaxID=69181 RepID=A0ABQ7AQ53_BRACR|nr:hypothetical protein DY000_02061725 [Brassica cretica]